MSGVRIRVLGPEDAVAIRDVRLEGLRLYPENFGRSWEEEAVQPLRFWRERFAGAHTLGAELDGELAGITVVSLNPQMKRAHNAEIGAVYVRERFHRRGVANALMQSAMEWLATTKTQNATLTVSADNIAAQKLYARFGFSVCGQLHRELNVDGSFSDELLMRTQIF